MGNFRTVSGISPETHTAAELDRVAREGGCLRSIGYGFDCSGPGGEAHGYRAVWRNMQGMGNHGALVLEALIPGSRQADLLRQGARTAWWAAIERCGGLAAIIARRGEIFTREGESVLDPVTLNSDWAISLYSSGLGVRCVTARLRPLSDHARQLLREARAAHVAVDVPGVSSIWAMAVVVAGESIRRGYDRDVLAQAAATPYACWEDGPLPRSNRAAERWFDRVEAPCHTDGVARLTAAFDVARAAAKLVPTKDLPGYDGVCRLADGRRIWSI